MVRAKFQVQRYETSLQGKEECRTIHLTAVYDGSPENKQFFKYTPNGRIEIGILNERAWREFPLGREVYVDFTNAAPRHRVMSYPCGCSGSGPEDLPTYCPEHGKLGDAGAIFTESPDATATK